MDRWTGGWIQENSKGERIRGAERIMKMERIGVDEENKGRRRERS